MNSAAFITSTEEEHFPKQKGAEYFFNIKSTQMVAFTVAFSCSVTVAIVGKQHIPPPAKRNNARKICRVTTKISFHICKKIIMKPLTNKKRTSE